MNGMLVLEDGTVFEGRSVGAEGFACGEAVFTTAMSSMSIAVAAHTTARVQRLGVICGPFSLLEVVRRGSRQPHDAAMEVPEPGGTASTRSDGRGNASRRVRPARLSRAGAARAPCT